MLITSRTIMSGTVKAELQATIPDSSDALGTLHFTLLVTGLDQIRPTQSKTFNLTAEQTRCLLDLLATPSS